MPAIRHDGSTDRDRFWSGDCPRPACNGTFNVAAETHQNRIMVLSALGDALAGPAPHVHGSYIVYDHGERGGE